MRLRQISIRNFRSFIHATFYFNPFLTIIIGKNSVGKTNLLEAIYCGFLGYGFREEKEEELIYYDKLRADIQLELVEGEEKIHRRLIIEKSTSGIKKTYFINKIKKKSHQFFLESLPVIVFSPNFLEIIVGEPAKRRKYFDDTIGFFDNEYKKRLINYENGLRKRNKILEKETEIKKLKDQLEFWDNYLINQAEYLAKKRSELVDFFNNHQRLNEKIFVIHYLKNELSFKTLKETFEKQFLLKKTLVGPQRDDFQILIQTNKIFKDVSKFGSRSEQRLAFFWLLINQINLYQEELKKKPIVLLDDVFSELDFENKKLILKLIKNYQTIITSTQRDILDLIEIPYTIINL